MIKIYLDIIQTTYNIGLNIEMNSKLSIDLSEIICNNFILGAKVKYVRFHLFIDGHVWRLYFCCSKAGSTGNNWSLKSSIVSKNDGNSRLE